MARKRNRSSLKSTTVENPPADSVENEESSVCEAAAAPDLFNGDANPSPGSNSAKKRRGRGSSSLDEGEVDSDVAAAEGGDEDGEDGGPSGEKRKRKRHRTRKKKPASGGDSGVGDAAEQTQHDRKTADAISETIYVEGIPWSCDENDLRDFFKGCGKIEDIRMARWQDSGMCRGYAHVSFAGVAGARAAFGRDGQYLKGRYLTVQAPQEPATEKARRANRMTEQPRGCRTVFVKNLPYDADEDGVAKALAGCGRIASVRLAMWNHTKKLKGFGYVEFSTERGAETCVRTQENLFVGGRPVVVDFETGAPKGSFRRQDGAQIKKTSADAGVGKGKAPKFKVHVK